MTFDRRLNRIERHLGQADPARMRIDLVRKITTGNVSDRDIRPLYELMKAELRVSMLLAAGALRTHAIKPLPAAPMASAVLIVVVPPDQSPPRLRAEDLRIHAHGATPLQTGVGRGRDLSGAEQMDIALWLRAKLLMKLLGEPTGMALRQTLATEWAEGPPPAELRKPARSQVNWLAEMEHALRVPNDMPIIRGQNEGVWERWDWVPLFERETRTTEDI